MLETKLPIGNSILSSQRFLGLVPLKASHRLELVSLNAGPNV